MFIKLSANELKKLGYLILKKLEMKSFLKKKLFISK